MADTQPAGTVEQFEEPARSYMSWPAVKLVVDRPLPGDIFLCIRHKMIKYKNVGDSLNHAEYDKLVYNRVKYLFIDEGANLQFQSWLSKAEAAEREQTFAGATPEQVSVLESTVALRRVALDLFANPTGEEQVKASISMSKKMVTEFLKKPYVVNNITQLQRYGRGAVDHSVNVAVMSVFLGVRMGYASQVILEHLSVGGLLHDIGKSQVLAKDEDGMVDEDDPALRQHPLLGRAVLEASKEIMREVPNEVRMIVAQHHEYLDGSGYPSKLKGLAVYDLARVVAIANVYDDLVSESTAPTLVGRLQQALHRLETECEGKLDPKKLEKSIKIIKTSFN